MLARRIVAVVVALLFVWGIVAVTLWLGSSGERCGSSRSSGCVVLQHARVPTAVVIVVALAIAIIAVLSVRRLWRPRRQELGGGPQGLPPTAV